MPDIMIQIYINEELTTESDVAFTLKHIANLVDEGYRIGYNPNWYLEGDEEE